MINARRIAPVRPKLVADARPLAAVGSVPDQWADTLARLVRSHQARLRAADPSRPWLSGDDGCDRELEL